LKNKEYLGGYKKISQLVRIFLSTLRGKKLLYLRKPSRPSGQLPPVADLIFEGQNAFFPVWSLFLQPERVKFNNIDVSGFQSLIDACKRNSKLEQVSLYFSEKSSRILKLQKFFQFIDTFNTSVKTLYINSCDFDLSSRNFLQNIESNFDKVNYSSISEKRYFGNFWNVHNNRETNILHVYNICFK